MPEGYAIGCEWSIINVTPLHPPGLQTLRSPGPVFGEQLSLRKNRARLCSRARKRTYGKIALLKILSPRFSGPFTGFRKSSCAIVITNADDWGRWGRARCAPAGVPPRERGYSKDVRKCPVRKCPNGENRLNGAAAQV